MIIERRFFSLHVYVGTIIQLLCTIAFILAGGIVYDAVAKKFKCENVTGYTNKYNEHILSHCHARYESMVFRSMSALFTFGIFSNVIPFYVAMYYSGSEQQKRSENSSSHQPPTEDEPNNQQLNQQFYMDISHPYYFHLIIRFLCGIMLIVLQHPVLLTSGMDSQFKCSVPRTNGSQSVNIIQCEYSIAPPQNVLSNIIFALNIASLLLISYEMLRLGPWIPIFQQLEDRYKRCVSNFIKALFCAMIGLIFILLIKPDIIQI